MYFIKIIYNILYNCNHICYLSQFKFKINRINYQLIKSILLNITLKIRNDIYIILYVCLFIFICFYIKKDLLHLRICLTLLVAFNVTLHYIIE